MKLTIDEVKAFFGECAEREQLQKLGLAWDCPRCGGRIARGAELAKHLATGAPLCSICDGTGFTLHEFKDHPNGGVTMDWVPTVSSRAVLREMREANRYALHWTVPPEALKPPEQQP